MTRNIKARFVWADGYVDSIMVDATCPRIRRPADDRDDRRYTTGHFLWLQDRLPDKDHVLHATFERFDYSDGSFEYREVAG